MWSASGIQSDASTTAAPHEQVNRRPTSCRWVGGGVGWAMQKRRAGGDTAWFEKVEMRIEESGFI